MVTPEERLAYGIAELRRIMSTLQNDPATLEMLEDLITELEAP